MGCSERALSVRENNPDTIICLGNDPITCNECGCKTIFYELLEDGEMFYCPSCKSPNCT